MLSICFQISFLYKTTRMPGLPFYPSALDQSANSQWDVRSLDSNFLKFDRATGSDSDENKEMFSIQEHSMISLS